MHSRTQEYCPCSSCRETTSSRNYARTEINQEKKILYTRWKSSIAVDSCEVQDREKQYSKEVYIPFKTNISQFCIHTQLITRPFITDASHFVKFVIQVVFNLHTKVTCSWCLVSILSSHFPIGLNMWKCVCNLTQVPYTVVAQIKTVVSMREGACVYIRIGLERSVVLLTVERVRRYRLRSTYLLIRNGCFKTSKYVMYRVSLRCEQLSRKGR